ncbi:MAG: radical SAM protein [Lachnospiraceae bacterium]|nr:radical SAM protein [Lachnospiraceae bacterium]
MKTTAIYIQNLCVPCNCHCRYCLLSWSNQLLGIDYDRSERFAKRFYEWIQEKKPEWTFNFYFGYSMEHPRLLDAIDFFRSIHSVNAHFLQFDGMKFRNAEEIYQLLSSIKEHGVEHLNFTIYGTKEYHDQFAARKGDFDYMLCVIDEAIKSELEVSVGVPITQENVGQIDELLKILKKHQIEKIRLFVPHEEGRGASLNSVRFREKDYQLLSEEAKALFSLKSYKTEREWVTYKTFAETENRALIISLTPDNIEMFESMSCEEIIAYVEELDETYYSVFPSIEELTEMYGDKEGEAFYQQRDLLHHYQQRYIKEHNLKIYDVTDERQCGSRRY